MKILWILCCVLLLAIGSGCGGQLDSSEEEDRDTGSADVNSDATANDTDILSTDTTAQDTDSPSDRDAADTADNPDSGDSAPDVEEPDIEEPVDDCPNVKVTAPEGMRLFIRPEANTSGEAVGALYRDSIVEVIREVEGESISGNTTWYEITSAAGDGYISGEYAVCTTDATFLDECPNVEVTTDPGVRLNIRPTASTSGNATGSLYGGMVVRKVAEAQGQSISGNTLWYQIESVAGDGFISAAYAECTTEPPAALGPPDGFYLPLVCGTSARVSQGNNGGFSHQGLHRYAWDFALGIGTPMVAMADGLVLHTYAGTAPGSACDGGGQSCVNYANHVVLLHGDDTTSTYRHLSAVHVNEGDFVPRGTTVGLSGQTGWSTGPHAHVMRMTNCGSAFPPSGSVCQSIPTRFEDYSANGGVPTTGVTVTSGNCP